MKIVYDFYRTPLLSEEKVAGLLAKIRKIVPEAQSLETERTFYVGSKEILTTKEREKLHHLLSDRRNKAGFSDKPFLSGSNVIEVGPRLNFATSDSTNAVSICRSCGLTNIHRLEQGRRYKVVMERTLTAEESEKITALVHDKMVECNYPEPLTSFSTGEKPKPLVYIPILKEGKQALIDAKKKYGSSMDDIDMNYVLYLFRDVWKRDMTDVEFCYSNNANSEHSRHHIFRAKLIIDGELMPFTLMGLVQSMLKNKENSIIAFHDNSSVISGFKASVLIPDRPGMPSSLRMTEILYHLVLTAETHNHPSLWEAYAGAATGGGGRRRDNQATGRGAMVVAGGAGFMGGNLNIEEYPLPWEDPTFLYDERTESPLSFFVRATNGCFDDGNQFGEPVINLFFESFGMRIGGQRWENVKPVMFTVGFGFIDDRHITKHIPEQGWLVVKVGGDAYRIGFGGGDASSRIAGENDAQLDMNSVQRADGEMANKTNRLLRSCLDMGDKNPLESGSDQGAGGITNVALELIFPAGAKFYLRRIRLGDDTLSPAEILVCEFQENLHFIVKPENVQTLLDLGQREDVPVTVIGEITGDGRAVIVDEQNGESVLDLELKHIFSEYPQKEMSDTRQKLDLKPLAIPEELNVYGAAEHVLRHLGVCSKEWAVNKVDQSVTGKIVQSMRDGVAQLPICDYSIITPGPFTVSGQVNAIGQRPAIGLISPKAMVRMVTAESLMKLAPVVITKRSDIKASANWMLAVKLSGGLAWLTDGVVSLKESTDALEIDINGGKDSLSMAAKVPDGKGGTEVARSLSTLVLSVYAQCPNYELRVTPSLKKPGESSLIFVDLANGHTRMGGSVLAQCLGQVGDECPDMDNPYDVRKAFDVVQNLVSGGLISAYHHKDRAGLLATLLEMSFSGNCGIDLELSHRTASSLEMLFNEELGFVIECHKYDEARVFEAFREAGLDHLISFIGQTTVDQKIAMRFNGEAVLDNDMRDMRLLWRQTSYQMELQQNVPSCVESEMRNLYDVPKPPLKLTFNPDQFAQVREDYAGKPKVAVLRVEGVNSDEEAKNALYLAGFDVEDVTINDIRKGLTSLRRYRGILFPGGFSYKDVLGSAKGWEAVIRYDEVVAKEFKEFFERPDTWSLGICNGCQLMTELGVVPYAMPEEKQPAFVHNKSEKFESRLVYLKIEKGTSSLFFKGMEGSILPVHVANGEGRFDADDEVLAAIKEQKLVTVRYVGPDGMPTEEYPFSPNVSKDAIAGLCTPDGRHNIIMPHPERTASRYQLPNSTEWRFENSFWLRGFQNLCRWCDETK